MDTQAITSRRQWTWLRRRLGPIERSYLRSASLILLTAWLINNARQTIQRIVDFYTPMPLWDYLWRVVFNYSAYRSFHWSVLWNQHNEHRIVFPELIFAADMLWLHGRLVLPLVVSFLCYLAAWIALSSAVLADRRLSGFQRSLAFLLAGIIVFWKGSVYVLAVPFLLQWTLMQLGTACSFVCLSRIKEASSFGPLLGTIIAATIATYSSGNALVLWPLIIVFAFFLRLNKAQFIALASSALINLVLYFIGYHSSGALNLRNFFVHPFSTLGFLASYVSMPFGGMKTPSFGVTMGLISIGGTAAFFFVALHKRLGSLPPVIVLLGYYALTLLTALITAAGRMDPADAQFGGAKAPRYVTVPQMNWGVFVLFCLWVAWSVRWPKWIGYLMAAGFSLFLFIYVPKLNPWLSANDEFFAEQQLAVLSVENGLWDKNLLLYIYPDLPTLSAGFPILQKEKLSIYSHPRSSWLGKPASTYASIQGYIPGAITAVAPVDSGLQVTGWVDASQWRSPYQGVMLTDSFGRIVGLGSCMPIAFPNAVRNLTTPAPLGWVGFIPERLQPSAVSAYIVDPRKKHLSPLASSVNVPPVRIVATSDLGSPIQSVGWKSDIPGTAGLIPVHIKSNIISTPIQSSWAGSDTFTGTIASSVFSVPANGCMILPVIHGPVGDQVSVTIKDAGTGAVLLDQTLSQNDQQWEFWRVQLKPAEKISIVAKDKGSGWGEWLAVASPSTCR